ncbi:AMP-binding protein, partial [Pseudonocardia eucalypti]|uniref:AMP-binding protein n=1 Tax=Pseudonocardia eucalypti TaxID=648755 RepID=UPI0031F15EDA
MTALVESSEDYWQDVLRAGGYTALPRWARHPQPGTAEHTVAVSGEVAASLRRLAGELGVPVHDVLLAAHARVLAALTGEVEVTTGCVVDGVALPCRLDVESASWRSLAAAVAQVETRLRAHAGFAPEALREGPAEPLFDTVFDPAGEGSGLGLPDGVVLGVGAPESGEGFEPRLRYRTEALDADAAARIAGYFGRACELIAADPDADPRGQSLLGAEELRLQLVGMAGPSRELPDVRPHQLFEQRVRLHPDEVAARHAGHQLTYAQVNARANRVARALHAAGVGREDVVAVVTERNLDWLVAVLAVFKAGGVYLPIEPHFPAERIATTLRRADCALALTEPDSTQTLDAALAQLPGVPTLFVADAYTQDLADTDLDVAIDPGQLAYIYFTSGSTGEPKGAMCEHAGMLNHLFAKIDDLDITHGSVVAQIAPQCFDISLWQLLAPLLVGGRTLLVEQEVILDAARFVDTL